MKTVLLEHWCFSIFLTGYVRQLLFFYIDSGNLATDVISKIESVRDKKAVFSATQAAPTLSKLLTTTALANNKVATSTAPTQVIIWVQDNFLAGKVLQGAIYSKLFFLKLFFFNAEERKSCRWYWRGKNPSKQFWAENHTR